MKYSENETKPVEWSGRRLTRRQIASLIVLAPIPLFTPMLAVSGVTYEDPYMVKYGILLSLLFWLIVASGISAHVSRHRVGSIRNVCRNGVQATVIGQSRLTFGVYAGLYLTMTVFGYSAAFDSARNAEGVTALLAFVVFAGMGTSGVGFLPLVLTRRLQLGRLVLTPNEVHQRGWCLESTLAWDSILEVKPTVLQQRVVLLHGRPYAEWKRVATVPRIWAWDLLPPVPVIEVYCYKHALDPVFLYRLLRFYTEHPEYRAELGTEAALDRARSGNYF